MPDGARAITVQSLQREVRRTQFAAPTTVIQPKGNKTLVTLPTYFACAFSSAGFEPGEVQQTTILGQTLRIRPVFKSNTVVFGDGASTGPTSSMGGPYPTGDLVHEYQRKGTYNTFIRTEYTAEFALNDGTFVPVPGTVTITGPTQPLGVLTAKNRLVNDLVE